MGAAGIDIPGGGCFPGDRRSELLGSFPSCNPQSGIIDGAFLKRSYDALPKLRRLFQGTRRPCCSWIAIPTRLNWQQTYSDPILRQRLICTNAVRCLGFVILDIHGVLECEFLSVALILSRVSRTLADDATRLPHTLKDENGGIIPLECCLRFSRNTPGTRDLPVLSPRRSSREAKENLVSNNYPWNSVT